MGRATSIILKKGKAYLNMGKYLSLHVYTRDMLEIYHLKRTFGGNHYQHGGLPTGIGRQCWVWRLNKKNDLLKVFKSLEEARLEDGECPESLLPLIDFCRNLRSQSRG